MVWNIAGKGFTRFRAQAAIDERSRKSDIGPAVRFFVFTEKPNPDRLIRLEGEPAISLLKNIGRRASSPTDSILICSPESRRPRRRLPLSSYSEVRNPRPPELKTCFGLS